MTHSPSFFPNSFQLVIIYRPLVSVIQCPANLHPVTVVLIFKHHL